MTRHLLLAADPASTIIGSSHQVKRDYGEQVATQIGNRYPARLGLLSQGARWPLPRTISSRRSPLT